MCFGVLTTSIFNHRGLWCSFLSWFTLEADEVQIFSGVALTLCCMAAFLLSGKQSSSPEARQSCGCRVRARAVVVTQLQHSAWVLMLIAPSLPRLSLGSWCLSPSAQPPVLPSQSPLCSCCFPSQGWSGSMVPHLPGPGESQPSCNSNWTSCLCYPEK